MRGADSGTSRVAVITGEADITDRDSLVAAAQRVQDELGGADVLVTNAGAVLLGPFAPISALSSRGNAIHPTDTKAPR